ncbi:MAG: RNA ligase family protein [Bacteroidia bacterium]
MNTPFSEFEKMPAQLKTLHLTEKQMKDIEKSLWVVTEKAHGANFSFVYENRTLQFAKRKAYLNWGDDFFGFQLVVEKWEEKILAFFEQLSREIPAEKYLLYGELIGGAYPHNAVKAVEKIQAIQTGVYYCPDIQFFAFDIALENVGEKRYLDYEIALSYFEQHQFLHAKPLFVGKFTACMAFPTRINSTIPQMLSLPPLEHNTIEGIVIKLYQNSQEIAYQPRIILKIKNDEFAEKSFHQAEKWSYLPEVRSKSEELAFILEEMRKYVSQNRLQNVLSDISHAIYKKCYFHNEFIINTLSYCYLIFV